MALTIRRSQTISNGVTMRGNDTQYIRPIDPLGKLFELDASIYASGTTLLDISGNDHHATIHGSPAWDSDAGGCFVFDANASKYIDIAGSGGGWGLAGNPAQATFSVWTKIPGPYSFQHVAGWRGGLNMWLLLLGDSRTEARFDNGQSQDVNMDYTPYHGSWTYITFVVDAANSRTKLYINANEVGGASNISGNFPSAGNNFVLGCDIGNTNSFALSGKIGGTTAYNKALTQQEVTTEFNRTKTRYGL